MLIAHKVDLDQINHVGATPIMAAAANDKTTVLRLLILEGADVSAARNDGACAIYLAGLNLKDQTIDSRHFGGHVSVVKCV